MFLQQSLSLPTVKTDVYLHVFILSYIIEVDYVIPLHGIYYYGMGATFHRERIRVNGQCYQTWEFEVTSELCQTQTLCVGQRQSYNRKQLYHVVLFLSVSQFEDRQKTGSVCPTASLHPRS